ncbi:MAG TPA: hypothetical protein VLG91_07955, partial [Streptomyces sp.]|nr:hypothetical protein [Streptomyces sp.]
MTAPGERRVRHPRRVTGRRAATGRAAHAPRIGGTHAFVSGRPLVSVEDRVSPVATAPRQPSSRSLTAGSYRGDNPTFPYRVLASAWQSNTSENDALDPG